MWAREKDAKAIKGYGHGKWGHGRQEKERQLHLEERIVDLYYRLRRKYIWGNPLERDSQIISDAQSHLSQCSHPPRYLLRLVLVLNGPSYSW